MHIKRWVTLAAATMFMVGAGGCAADAIGGESGSGSGGGSGANKFPAGTTMRRLSGAKKVRVGTKFDQPGFGLKGLDGKLTGFDVEIARIVAGELGIAAEQIEWMETPSAVREQVIEENKVDYVVATYTINEARKQRIGFAGPYYVAGQHIMVRTEESAITGPDSFKSNANKKVCSVTNSTPAGNIKKYLTNEARQLVLFDTYQKCVDALSTKRVDAVTTDNVILLGYVSKSDGKFKLAGTKFTNEPYGVGVRKDDAGFRNWINDVLEKAVQDGRYQKAWQDTAGKFDTTPLATPTVNRY